MASPDRLIGIFNEAEALPAGPERERFLAESCQDDPELREQVRSLLLAHERAGHFLDHAPVAPTVRSRKGPET